MFTKIWFVVLFGFACDSLRSSVLPESTLSNTRLKRMVQMMPRVMYCGIDHLTRSDEDGKYFHDTDVCCRFLDYCREYVSGSMDSYGLHNEESVTRFSCNCENQFYECLHRIDSVNSRFIIRMYQRLGPKKCLVGPFVFVNVSTFENIVGTYKLKKCVRSKRSEQRGEEDLKSVKPAIYPQSETEPYGWTTIDKYQEPDGAYNNCSYYFEQIPLE